MNRHPPLLVCMGLAPAGVTIETCGNKPWENFREVSGK